MALSHFSSSTSICWKCCILSLSNRFSLTIEISDDHIFCWCLSDRSNCVLSFRSLPLSHWQVPWIESTHWHHLTSGRQPQSAVHYVRSDWRIIALLPLTIYINSDDPIFNWFHCQSQCVSFVHCNSFRDFSKNRFNGTLPQLGNLTNLSTLYYKISSLSLTVFSEFWRSMFNRCHSPYQSMFPPFLHCHSFRDFSSNQLTGTIPPQLGTLSQLSYLYAYIQLVSPWHQCFMIHFSWFHGTTLSITVALLGASAWISSLALSRLSSATSLCSPICALRIAPFSISFRQYNDYRCWSIVSWFHSQPLISPLSGTSKGLSSMAPYHLSLATSLGSSPCTINIMSISMTYSWSLTIHIQLASDAIVMLLSFLHCRSQVSQR